MAVREILQLGDPGLRRACAPVADPTAPGVAALARDLADALVHARAETMVVWDACLSFLSIFFQVRRHCWVRVRWQDLDGAEHELRAEGDLSELLQHELDHLDGVLAVDRMTDVRTLCTRAEFEKRHRAASPYARRADGAAAART